MGYSAGLSTSSVRIVHIHGYPWLHGLTIIDCFTLKCGHLTVWDMAGRWVSRGGQGCLYPSGTRPGTYSPCTPLGTPRLTSVHGATAGPRCRTRPCPRLAHASEHGQQRHVQLANHVTCDVRCCRTTLYNPVNDGDVRRRTGFPAGLTVSFLPNSVRPCSRTTTNDRVHVHHCPGQYGTVRPI